VSISVEITVPVEALMHVGPAWVTAPEAVTGHSSRLAGRVNRKHDRQCGERDKCQLFRTSQVVHRDTSLSPPTPWDDTPSRNIQLARQGARLADRQIIDARNPPTYETVCVELPVLVSARSEPVAAIVARFIGESDRDPILVTTSAFKETPKCVSNPLSRSCEKEPGWHLGARGRRREDKRSREAR
jgi:hypothetical protein